MVVKKKHFLYIAIILLAMTNLYSQDRVDSSKTNFIFPRYSLQFEIDDLLKFSAYEGLALSAKYHNTNHSAIRFSCTVSSDIVEQKYTSLNIGQDSTINSDKNNYTYIYFKILYLYYFNPQNEIKAFIGLGPKVGFRYRTEDYNNNSGYRKNSDEQTYWSLGIGTSYGAEWFFKKNMSLMLSYGMDFSYISYNSSSSTKYKSSNYQDRKYKQERSEYRIDSKQVILGLSLYFNP